MKNRKIWLVFFLVLVCTIGGFLLSLHFGESTAVPSQQSKSNSSSSSIKKPERSSVSAAAIDSVSEASSGEETYWLHKSSLKLPDKSVCLKAQKQALAGLSDAQKENVQTAVREEHVRIEFFLLREVALLKSPRSPYWAYLEHTGTISIPGDAKVWNVWDKDTIIESLKAISSPIKNEAVKSDFKQMQDTLQAAVERHDLRKVFSYHEMIHDYDYWIINYPAYFPTAAPPDWAGIQVYFGTPSLSSGN